jgi:hypothetical protein
MFSTLFSTPLRSLASVVSLLAYASVFTSVFETADFCGPATPGILNSLARDAFGLALISESGGVGPLMFSVLSLTYITIPPLAFTSLVIISSTQWPLLGCVMGAVSLYRAPTFSFRPCVLSGEPSTVTTILPSPTTLGPPITTPAVDTTVLTTSTPTTLGSLTTTPVVDTTVLPTNPPNSAFICDDSLSYYQQIEELFPLVDCITTLGAVPSPNHFFSEGCGSVQCTSYGNFSAFDNYGCAIWGFSVSSWVACSQDKSFAIVGDVSLGDDPVEEVVRHKNRLLHPSRTRAIHRLRHHRHRSGQILGSVLRPFPRRRASSPEVR